ncbi:unnamed protein product [Diplocarpon coronariae]
MKDVDFAEDENASGRLQVVACSLHLAAGSLQLAVGTWAVRRCGRTRQLQTERYPTGTQQIPETERVRLRSATFFGYRNHLLMEDLQAKTKGKARRSRKKKEANTNTSKPTIVHTKRKEVEGNDGWIHIVDKPRSNKANAKAFTQLLQGGDFEINGVNYVHRTLAEMEEEFDHWKRSWGERPACKDLKERIRDIENARKIQNIVVLGLGSLQSARREGRRASATQLAALQTIVGSLERGAELQLTFQDPQFTDVDKEFLTSLGYKVVDDPGAFTEVGEGSLVYAIHCYGEVYKAISQRPRPAVLIGTNVENFRRFDSQVTLHD